MTADPAPFIQLATALAGLVSWNANQNVTATYRGQLLRASPDEAGETVVNAIVKDLPTKELANEIVVAAMAHHLGLPVPQPFIVEVRDEVLTLRNGPQIDGGRLAFGSQDVKAPAVMQQLDLNAPASSIVIKEVAAWGHIGSLYGADSWVANTDRHTGNLLFDGPGSIWLIDHGRCFFGHEWTASDLVPDATFRNRLKEWLTPSMVQSHREAARLVANRIEAHGATVQVRDLPEVAIARRLIGDGDTDALMDFLEGRLKHIPVLASQALDLPTLV